MHVRKASSLASNVTSNRSFRINGIIPRASGDDGPARLQPVGNAFWMMDTLQDAYYDVRKPYNLSFEVRHACFQF